MAEKRGAGSAGADGPDNRFERAERELARGLQFANMLASANQEASAENTVLLQALVEVLISKGIVHVHELEKRKKDVAESLARTRDEIPGVQLVDTQDKYEPGNDVVFDCANRWPICKMVCCRLWFALSAQDLAEGVVKWNYGIPYGIAQGEDGFCVHLDRSAGGCTIYAQRPLICRTYHCRDDRRIWVDFERKVLSAEALQALAELETPLVGEPSSPA